MMAIREKGGDGAPRIAPSGVPLSGYQTSFDVGCYQELLSTGPADPGSKTPVDHTASCVARLMEAHGCRSIRSGAG
jgi:hypothetical protein